MIPGPTRPSHGLPPVMLHPILSCALIEPANKRTAKNDQAFMIDLFMLRTSLYLLTPSFSHPFVANVKKDTNFSRAQWITTPTGVAPNGQHQALKSYSGLLVTDSSSGIQKVDSPWRTH